MSSSVLTNLEKMKRQIIIEVEDPVFEKFMGMLEICPGVEFLAVSEVAETRTNVDLCVAMAIN